VLRHGALTALLILSLIIVLASPLSDPAVTVSYTIQGGYSESYTAIPYVTEAFAGVTKPATASYMVTGGVSTGYRPLVYIINTELVIENIKWSVPLRVHVRLLKADKTYIPDFDVDYTVNGTQRTARKGEDSLNITFNYYKAYWKDPVVLVFPDAVEGHRLLNSTTIIVDPFVTPDVYVYYYAEVTEPIKPTVPTTPEGTPTGATPMSPRGYIFIPWWLVEFIASYWWLLLLLLILIVAVYMYHRHRSGVSVEIEIPRWAY
jgi:hypothetical protein